MLESLGLVYTLLMAVEPGFYSDEVRAMMSNDHFHSVNPEYLQQISVDHLLNRNYPEGQPLLDVRLVPSKVVSLPIIGSGEAFSRVAPCDASNAYSNCAYHHSNCDNGAH
jgi:hypothetical protein